MPLRAALSRSDSSNLDAVFENLLRFGKTPAQSLSILVPEAYRDQPAYDAHPEIVNMVRLAPASDA